MEIPRPTIKISNAAIILALGLSALTCQASDSKSWDATLIGDWHGSSVCIVRPSACNDEDSLYHVAKIADRPGWFSMKADKIVSGKPVTMGTVECSGDEARRTLDCEFERGVFQFGIQGNEMQGSMKLKGGTLWRKISLKKTK
ncbi:MAG TPA: hypothetical protein VIW67_14695 [Terriglobales bacterium]|jgi:hypothetical protein